MQDKTIKSILSRKMSAWWKSIDDTEVRELVKKNTVVTGGAIVSMLLDEPISDFDVYMRTREAAFRLADYYVKKVKEDSSSNFSMYTLYLTDSTGLQVDRFQDLQDDRIKLIVKSVGVVDESDNADDDVDREIDESGSYRDELPEAERQAGLQTVPKEGEKPKKEYRVVFMTSNAITLSDKIQFVLRFHGEPSEIHENYDFEHCKCYWTSWDRKLVLPHTSLRAMMERQLVYNGSLYPVCSLFRIRKFVQRGWKINAGQILKIAMQVSNLNLMDPNVLEDQLLGVDTAFFQRVIDLLREKMEKDGTTEFESTYLVELIDKVF